MKKYIKLLCFFTAFGFGHFGFAQSPYKFAPLITDNCYKGLSGSAVNMGEHNGSYSWGYRVKNNYNVPIEFRCRLVVGGEEYAGGGYDVTGILNPGQTYCQSNSLFNALQFNTNSTNYIIQVKDVCFNKDGCFKSGYADCDNGTPNQSTIKNTQNKNQNQTSNTQQNDLTEYNRSKAEMEQKMNEQNAEIANKRQQYTNSINAGISAHNLGNFADAKSHFSTAINLSNNTQEKESAQDYYNKSENSESRNTKINAVSDLITTTASALDDMNKQIKENKAIKAEKEKMQKISYDDLADDDLFDAFVTDVVFEFKKFGYNPIVLEKKIVKSSKLITTHEIVIKSKSIVLKYKDFSALIDWNFNGDYGEDKNINILCKEENISEEFKKNKILDKWSRKNKPEYHIKSKSIDNWRTSIKDIEFTRSTVINLDELIKKHQEIELINKQYELTQKTTKEKAETEALAATGVQLPIQTEKELDKNITVKFIIENHINAIGGYKNLKAVKTITEFTESDKGNYKSITGYGKYYREGTYMNYSTKSIFNGTTGYSEFNSKKTPFNETINSNYKKMEPFSILVIQQSEFKLGKIETINSEEYYTIISKDKTYYFNKNNGLWKGSKFIYPTFTSYTFYDDYRVINNISFPFSRIDFSEKDLKNITKTLTKEIKINEPNIDANFE
jgi:hypothetical protein